jgi:tetratricopeptide (TPR) repeat protein
MIVKDESHIIAACLERLRPYVDAWCIVDTGSTDGTQDAVREAMKGLPGELHERPWQSFAHNRTECFDLAKEHGDYVLVMDADDVWDCPDGFAWPDLDLDGYSLDLRGASLSWRRLQLLRTASPWHYEDPVHAVAVCEGKHVTGYLPGPVIRPTTTGRRHVDSNPKEKYLKDAKIYEEALRTEPDNTRYRFYLAESFRYAHENAAALVAYEHRAGMGGWREEVWYSLFQAGRMAWSLGDTDAAVLHLEAAHQHYPERAEAMSALATLRNQQKNYVLAHLAASVAVERKAPPQDALFAEHQCYEWRARDQYAIACYYTGRLHESYRTNRELLDIVPEGERSRIEANMEFSRRRLGLPVHTEASEGPKLLVMGCGRSGTGFVAKVLTEAGLKAGHERVFHPGTRTPEWGATQVESSWLALPWLPTLGSDVHVLHLVRNPIKNARSWMGVGMFATNAHPDHEPYREAVRRCAPGVMDYSTGLERWLAHWVVWNEIAAHHADGFLRIEDLDRDEGEQLGRVCEDLGFCSAEAVMDRYDAVPSNFNTRIVDEGVSMRDILSLDPGLVRRFVALCELYGYCEEELREAGQPALGTSAAV